MAAELADAEDIVHREDSAVRMCKSNQVEFGRPVSLYR